MTAVKRTLTRQRHIITNLGQGILAGPGDDARGHWSRSDKRNVVNNPKLEYNRYDNVRYNLLWDLANRKGANDYMNFDDQVAEDLESASKLSPTDALGFRGLFLTECARFAEQRDFDFKRYAEYADDLERAVIYKMDFTKDKQESAIYAFTIVTIVFLPLSAISSIFGMNTSDIRDLDAGQWLYWAVALPVTFGIIVIGLWWMGELGSMVGWMTGRLHSQSRQVRRTKGKLPSYLVESSSSGSDEDLDIPIRARRRIRRTRSVDLAP